MSKIGKKENGRYLSWKDTSNGPYSWMSKTHLLWDKFTFILLFSCWLLHSPNMNFYANGFYKDTLLVYIYKSCMEVSQTLFLAFSIIRYPFWLFHKWRGSSSKKRQGQFGHSNKANPIVLIQTRLISYLVCTINAGYAASYFHIVLPNPERVATQSERMMPTNTTTKAAGFHQWNSPIPYLFCGLGLTLGLIALALVLLACSFRMSPSNSSTQEEEKPGKEVEKQTDMEPRFVVMMPGDDKPKFLAKPAASDRQSEQVWSSGVIPAITQRWSSLFPPCSLGLFVHPNFQGYVNFWAQVGYYKLFFGSI